jgi:hypothetical protein
LKKSEQLVENVACADCADFFGGFSADKRDEGADLPPAERTCALCRRPVDGTEHLVAIGDRPPVWLHRDCERSYLHTLELDSDDPDEERNPDLRAPDVEERDR